MGDIVYWEGGEYLAPKAVASAVIVSTSKIRVDWGDGDVEIMDGESWTPSSSSAFQRVANMMFSYNITDGFNSCKTANNVIDLQVLDSAKLSASGIANATGSQVILEGFRGGFSYNGVHSFWITAGNTFSVSTFHKHFCNWGIVRVPATGGNRQFGDGYLESSVSKKRITTNTWAFSERETIVDPDVSLLTSCAIAITYEDATTEELPLSYCPPWVRIRTDEECPEGTCSVECEDHICCYDCSGKAVLVIPK